MATKTWTRWFPGTEVPTWSPLPGVYYPGTRIWDFALSRQVWIRATSPKPTARIPKPDGSWRIIQIYGQGTEVGRDAEAIAGMVKPLLVRLAHNLATRTGVVWTNSIKAPEAILFHILNGSTKIFAADLRKAFWQVRKRDVYRILRRAGIPRPVAALISWQATDNQADGDRILAHRLSMGHPLSPIILVIWILLTGKNFFKELIRRGARISLYVDNIQISGIPFPTLVRLQTLAGRLRWKKDPKGRAWKTLVPGGPPEMGTVWVKGGTPYSKYWLQPHKRRRILRRALRLTAKALAGTGNPRRDLLLLQKAQGLDAWATSHVTWGRARVPGKHRLSVSQDPTRKRVGGRPVGNPLRSARLRRGKAYWRST
jgi:hypothetical protein